MSSQPGRPTEGQPSPRAQLQEMIVGFRPTQLIHVAAKLGIADLLKDGPKSCDEIAVGVGVHSRSLYRVLRALASLGIFAETLDGEFELTTLAEPLQTAVPGSLRAWAIMWGEEWMWRPWGEILHTVVTGENSFDRIFGAGFFEYLSKNTEASEIFNTSMTARSESEVAAVLAVYSFVGASKIVDVGGGEGTLIAAILKSYPETHGILFDVPSVIESSRHLMQAQGVSARCSLVGGDFFAAIPPGGDCYIFHRVIHNWHDESATSILRNCRSVMPDNGKLIIADGIVPPGNAPSYTKLLDIHMMLTFEALQRTEDEFRSLLADAGFKLNRVLPTQAGVSVIEGIPL